MKKITFLTLAGLTLAPFASIYAGAISSSDLMVFQVGTSTMAASSTASQLVIDEINPSLTNQTSAVQSFDISTMGSPLFADSEGSVGDLALSDNGTLLSFAGWTSASSSAENTVLGRGAGTLDVNGSYTLAATYTGISGNQARGAYSPDGTNWYFDDKGGVYTNGASSPLANSPNTHGIQGYNGSTYALVATTGSTAVGSITPATPNGTTFAYGGLTGLPVDKNAVGFTMAASGHSGAGVIDTLYLADDPSGSTNYIDKYSLVAGTWVTSGSTAIGSKINIDQLLAEPVTGGNVDLFYTGDPSSANGNAQVDELVDTSGYDATIALSGSTTLFTAASGEMLQGIAFAPVPEPSCYAAYGLGALLLFAGFRRLRAPVRKA
jgi:hypothetical protein